MNIGIILPAKMKKPQKKFPKCLNIFKAVFSDPAPIQVQKIEIFQGIALLVCIIPLKNKEILNNESMVKRLRQKMRKMFEDQNAWPLLEHPEIKGLYGLPEYSFDEIAVKISIKRFAEILSLIRGVGDLNRKEVTVTGDSDYLEYAITNLITKVKSLNILLADNSPVPYEAEQAFAETGIPVHITTDPDVLNRSALWIRFPNDHKSFDQLPQRYNGIIIDLEAAKVIDTRCKKLYRIVIEFSERIKSKIGSDILKGWKEGYLEGAVITVCSNLWDVGITETSTKLGMLLTLKA